MKRMSIPKGGKTIIFLFIGGVLLLLNSCEQYEYTSPLPGIAQVNLHAVYTQFDTTFLLNNFTIKVTEIQALEASGARANIYLEPKAIGTQPVVYNTLGRPVYEGTQIIGQYPLPPGDYVGLTFIIEPGSTVILDGYRAIGVRLSENYSTFIRLMRPFKIEESRTTVVTLDIDLDSTLAKQAYTYEYRPTYRISDVRYY